MMGVNNRWLLRRYPKLEKLEWIGEAIRTGELKTFFLQNPNVQDFTTDLKTFLRHRRMFMDSQIKLTHLTIINKFGSLINPGVPLNLEKILHTLHRRSFYKRLHFFGHEDDPVYEIAASISALETLYFSTSGIMNAFVSMFGPTRFMFKTVDVSPFANVTELGLYLSRGNLDVESIKLLINLERIYIDNPKKSVISPFIRHLVNLREIVAHENEFGFSSHFLDELLNDLAEGNGDKILQQFNDERSNLNGAQKVTIYVERNLFLIWKRMSVNTRLNLIEFIPVESHDFPCNVLLNGLAKFG